MTNKNPVDKLNKLAAVGLSLAYMDVSIACLQHELDFVWGLYHSALETNKALLERIRELESQR